MAKQNGRTARTTQRQRALDILFEADEKGLRSREELLALLEERQVLSTAQTPISGFGVEIVRAYAAHIGDVDTMIEASSEDWSLPRMNTVDRNCLRGAIAELMYVGTKRAAVIVEWAGLVRLLSTDKSVGFVMGVMNRAADIIEREEAHAQQGVSQQVDVEMDDAGLIAALQRGQEETPEEALEEEPEATRKDALEETPEETQKEVPEEILEETP